LGVPSDLHFLCVTLGSWWCASQATNASQVPSKRDNCMGVDKWKRRANASLKEVQAIDIQEPLPWVLMKSHRERPPRHWVPGKCTHRFWKAWWLAPPGLVIVFKMVSFVPLRFQTRNKSDDFRSHHPFFRALGRNVGGHPFLIRSPISCHVVDLGRRGSEMPFPRNEDSIRYRRRQG
jgi:hypothetical protein